MPTDQQHIDDTQIAAVTMLRHAVDRNCEAGIALFRVLDDETKTGVAHHLAHVLGEIFRQDSADQAEASSKGDDLMRRMLAHVAARGA